LPKKINLSWVPSNSPLFLFAEIINTNCCCQKFTLLRESPWTQQGKEVKNPQSSGWWKDNTETENTCVLVSSYLMEV